MEKPILIRTVVTWIRECDRRWFEDSFEPYPDLRLWNTRVEQGTPERVHGLLLTGGSDISATYLRQPVENPSWIHEPDVTRDTWEFAAIREWEKAPVPLLAICRGLQVLNVALGGTLLLDIPGHDNAKTINVQTLSYTPEARHRFAAVNSSHHQALDRLAPGMIIEARSADNVVEQVRLDSPVFALGTQYHPERDEIYRPLFDDFAAHVRKTPF